MSNMQALATQKKPNGKARIRTLHILATVGVFTKKSLMQALRKPTFGAIRSKKITTEVGMNDLPELHTEGYNETPRRVFDAMYFMRRSVSDICKAVEASTRRSFIRAYSETKVKPRRDIKRGEK